MNSADQQVVEADLRRVAQMVATLPLARYLVEVEGQQAAHSEHLRAAQALREFQLASMNLRESNYHHGDTESTENQRA